MTCYSMIPGPDCSERATCFSLNNCSDNGICVDFETCRCSVGYSGDKCDGFSCEDMNYCSEHGQCIGFDSCFCDEG